MFDVSLGKLTDPARTVSHFFDGHDYVDGARKVTLSTGYAEVNAAEVVVRGSTRPQ
jgi:hypothetical protein